MSSLKKIFKFITKVIAGLIGFVVIYLLVGWVLARITVDEVSGGSDAITIYIITNGVHTDIVMPVKNEQIDWSEKIKYEHSAAADSTYNYVAMGWGDKGFYLETPTWGDLKASTAFYAATGLSTTAMHVTYYRAMRTSDSCKPITISKEEYAKLITYIDDSFRQDTEGNFIRIETSANYGETDMFYEANGRYSIFTTCNTWANSGLKSSGQKAALWTAFDSGIFSKYE